MFAYFFVYSKTIPITFHHVKTIIPRGNKNRQKNRKGYNYNELVINSAVMIGPIFNCSSALPIVLPAKPYSRLSLRHGPNHHESMIEAINR